MRTQARRLAFGALTLLNLRRRGFFIPYRYADQVPARGRRGHYEALEDLFAAAEPAFLDLLARMDAHAEALAAIGGEKPPQPRWAQDWFPRFDGAAAYVLVRDRRPSRIVEVGSGHSTRFMARAIRDGALATQLTAIDPAPRADIAGLGATLVKTVVQNTGSAPFEELCSGDVLFIDSSHILMPGTDVDFLLNRVLPALPAGVLVQFHDVFLPDDYPPQWEWRGYNEQLGVAALLQGAGFRLLWASHYVASRMGEAVKASAAGQLPLVPTAHEGSLWLVKEADTRVRHT